ncbi:uncharacterized protein KY384_006901 [Bacidia gigantensis]|uniref:uncharacterized protein n=1 Tax=Bacidia gigantensis TaxID=2732470 RepID=UPI001D03C06C|nr:uncharacterized protein KY384_006901 [Bacidia gigantensis]KAG8527985.1 hypothetical protein KY384_006901 [Bacidia gigantensis]
MAINLTWLSHLRAKDLKALATAIGVSSSGTKPILTNSLQANLPFSVFARQSGNGNGVARDDASPKGKNKEIQEISSILSIDMGIKNLAYCRILPAQKPIITEWERLNVLKNNDSGATHTDVETGTKDAYDPLLYASHATAWVSALIERDPSALVLIERQRFRSGGGFAVQEWTLKVNMFEAMLYAVLETLKREGKWKGSVQGISPARVAGFWLCEGEEEASRGRRKHKGMEEKSRGNKTGKNKKSGMTAIVREWFQEGKSVLKVEGKAIKTKGHFFGKLEQGKTREKLTKIDDLADCLLQGMACLKWEENRQLICRTGMEALEKVSGHRRA